MIKTVLYKGEDILRMSNAELYRLKEFNSANIEKIETYRLNAKSTYDIYRLKNSRLFAVRHVLGYIDKCNYRNVYAAREDRTHGREYAVNRGTYYELVTAKQWHEIEKHRERQKPYKGFDPVSGTYENYYYAKKACADQSRRVKLPNGRYKILEEDEYRYEAML